jgi:hypothetical protein
MVISSIMQSTMEAPARLASLIRSLERLASGIEAPARFTSVKAAPARLTSLNVEPDISTSTTSMRCLVCSTFTVARLLSMQLSSQAAPSKATWAPFELPGYDAVAAGVGTAIVRQQGKADGPLLAPAINATFCDEFCILFLFCTLYLIG